MILGLRALVSQGTEMDLEGLHVRTENEFKKAANTDIILVLLVSLS
jgi:hypothetical protein